MRLIAITTPDFWPGEADAIADLLADGFERVHIRKPGADADTMMRLIDSIAAELRPRVTLHDRLELAAAAGIGGVHLNARSTRPPEGWSGLVSRSCHCLDELATRHNYSYVFLSPVFDSISKPGYAAKFDLDELSRSGLIDSRVFALGGITPDKLPALAKAGFGGAAMLGAAWVKYR